MTLFPIHNKWLTDITSIDGMATLFLPALGGVIWLLGTLLFLRDNWKVADWGDRKVFVPLLIIVGAIGLSGITADTWGGKVIPLFMGISLFSLYLVARVLGKDMFLPLAIGAAIASLGVILRGAMYPGGVTGGFIFERNYDIVVGYVLLGAALYFHRWQWVLASLALVAMFMSGSPEAVFALGILGSAVLVRKDWSRKMAIALLPVVLVAALMFGLGYGQKLYRYTVFIAEEEIASAQSEPLWAEDDISPIGRKWSVADVALADLKPLGEGYYVTDFTYETVHNVPLLIVQQLGWPGILAALAWLWVTIWCLVKTKWKYVWVLVLAMSVFDHFIWTQMAPFWWAIVGASTASSIKSDYVFRKDK